MLERNQERKIFIRFCILQAAYWSFYAAMPSYITAYMLNMGMNAGTLGILLAVQMGSAFAGSFLWGRYVDRRQASRKFFLIGISSAALLSVLLFLFADQPPALFLLYPLFGFMNGPIATTLDSWVISATGRVEAGAKSRTFGTLGYAVTMLISGMLIRRMGYGFMPWMGSAFLLIAGTIALLQPESNILPGKESVEKTGAKALLKHPGYMLLVGVVFFTGMAIGPINNMKVIVFENIGGDVGFLGWDAFIGCLIQSPFLLFAGQLKRIRREYRLIGGAVCAFLYAMLVYAANRPMMVIAGTIFTNISFGLLFPTMREMTEAYVDVELRTTAHSIIDAAYGSVASMIASAWSGSVIEGAGYRVMCVVCMIMEAIALVFCVRLLFAGRKRSHRKNYTTRRPQPAFQTK